MADTTPPSVSGLAVNRLASSVAETVPESALDEVDDSARESFTDNAPVSEVEMNTLTEEVSMALIVPASEALLEIVPVITRLDASVAEMIPVSFVGRLLKTTAFSAPLMVPESLRLIDLVTNETSVALMVPVSLAVPVLETNEVSAPLMVPDSVVDLAKSMI